MKRMVDWLFRAVDQNGETSWYVFYARSASEAVKIARAWAEPRGLTVTLHVKEDAA